MTTSWAHAAYVLARGLDYLGIALFLGGMAFLALLWPAGGDARGARRVILTGWLLGLVGTVGAIGLHGVWALGRPVGDAVRWDLVTKVLDLPFGQVWFARALLWVLAGVVIADLLRRGERAARSTAWRVGAGAVGLGLFRTSGMIGHAVDAPSTAWAQAAGLLHLTGISLWIGGLAMLLFGVLPRRRADELGSVVPKYSRLALVSVTLIVSAGVVLVWQVVGSLNAVLTTGYGRVLLTKLAIFLAVLLVAQASRSWVTRRLDFAVVLRGDAAVSPRPLRPAGGRGAGPPPPSGRSSTPSPPRPCSWSSCSSRRASSSRPALAGDRPTDGRSSLHGRVRQRHPGRGGGTGVPTRLGPPAAAGGVRAGRARGCHDQPRVPPAGRLDVDPVGRG